VHIHNKLSDKNLIDGEDWGGILGWHLNTESYT